MTRRFYCSPRVLFALCATLGAFALGAAEGGHAGLFTTFDVPGAGLGAQQGTYSLSINPAGVLTGQYLDLNNVFQGYRRTVDGTITAIDVLGAGAAAGQGSNPHSISPSGEIAGYYADPGGRYHGFLRARDGAITTFDAPGARHTLAVNINPAGVISGFFRDPSRVRHGFVRAPNGAITTFDAPGAGPVGTYTCSVSCMNPAAPIAAFCPH